LTKLFQLGDSHGTGRTSRTKGNLIGQLTANGAQDLSSSRGTAFEKIATEQAPTRTFILLPTGFHAGQRRKIPRLEPGKRSRKITISKIGAVTTERELLEEMARRRRAKVISSRIRKRSRKLSTREVRSKDDLAIQERSRARRSDVRPVVEFIDGID